MNNDYDDIRSRISEPPDWFDENAVPRYGAFHPRALSNIYADEAALLEITCQGCGERFHVALSSWAFSTSPGMEIHNLIKSGDIHYGDPPNVGCCAAGPTMNSEPRRVLEYWKRGDITRWERDASLEIKLDVDWVRDNDKARDE